MLDNCHWLTARENELLTVMDIRDLISNDDHDGSENVAKNEFAFFQLIASVPLNMSNAGDFSWS